MNHTSTIDLHVHSTFSDGTFTPSELVKEANRIGLAAFALTDHDTVNGIPEAFDAAKGTSLEVIPGIELSTEYQKKEVHVVGLYIDYENRNLCECIDAFRQCRDHRNEQIITLLQQEGFDITMEQLQEENKDAVITRANIARFLVDHKQVDSLNKVFEKYLGDNCRCYVPRKKITPMEACDLIRNAGGIPVLAHPVLYHMNIITLNSLIQEMKPHGLMAIEAIYSTYTKGDENLMRRIALENDLLISGGSDFHGSNKPYIKLGTGRGNNLNIPYSVLDCLKEAR